MRLVKTSLLRPLFILVAGLSLATTAGCGSDEVRCTDICEELDSCFQDFDESECFDRCEDQPEPAIDACNDCVDDSENECVDCTGAVCSIFIEGGMVVPPL